MAADARSDTIVAKAEAEGGVFGRSRKSMTVAPDSSIAVSLL